MIYSGNSSAHVNGVGIIMTDEVASAIAGYYAVSERVIVVKLRSKPFNCNIIQVYAKTSTSTEDEIENFYDNVEEAYRQCKPGEMTIVMGDLNAKVGCRSNDADERTVLGPFGLGNRNEWGERWIEWCLAKQQVIKNTWFKQPSRRLYTWRSPGVGVRNQINYITINRRFHTAVTAAKTYPGADCGSDHTPMICKLQLRLRKPKKLSPRKTRRQYEFGLLKTNKTVAEEYRNRVCQLMEQEPESEDAEGMRKILTEAMIKASVDVIPERTRNGKQKWMTNEILQLMTRRREAKISDLNLYRQLDRDIRRKCRTAKEVFLNGECERIQQLEHQKRYKMMYDEIRRVTGRGRKSSDTGCLQNARGEILMDTEDILKRWKEYIEELFADTRGLQPFYSTGDERTHRNFTEDEVRDAIQKSARGKAPGPDDLQVEMIQASGNGGVTAVTKLINAIYQEGKVPEGMCKSVFIALPKKAGTTRCDEHRIISLMSHLTKILVRLLITRIKGRTMHW